jgi:YHS domain-containing protein
LDLPQLASSTTSVPGALPTISMTDCTISSMYKGKTYCFGSAEAQTNFMKSPDENLAKAEVIL